MTWTLATQKSKQRRRITTQKDQTPIDVAQESESTEEHSKVFNRYYHMFSKGELQELTITAARGLGLGVGNELDVSADQGVEIVQCGWEKSNYYIEIRRWRR
jgi:tRNA (uracil-5-)-methyltransferase TRM9